MAIRKPRGTQRIGYFDGQLLAARDLQDDAAYESRMRSLHVRYIHKTWGIALGYELTINQDQAGGAIAVAPGLAYDAYGRELVSAQPLSIDLPATTPEIFVWWDLVIRYLDLRALINGRDLRSPCQGSMPTEERPEMSWHFAGGTGASPPPLAGTIQLGVDIPIGRFLIGENAFGRRRALGSPNYSLCHYAQGLVRPHIFSAQLDAGAFNITGSPLAWSLTIDTTAGGFTQTVPNYFVTLLDHPLGPNSLFSNLFSDQNYYDGLLGNVLGPFVSIQSPHQTQFTLNVNMALPPPGDVSQLLSKQTSFLGVPLPVAVQWLGIEPAAGCSPN